VTLTREQIEEWREWLTDPAPWPSEQQRVAAINALCDASLPSGVMTKNVPVIYWPCEKHLGVSWNGAATSVGFSLKTTCPVCEPPAPEAAPHQNAGPLEPNLPEEPKGFKKELMECPLTYEDAYSFVKRWQNNRMWASESEIVNKIDKRFAELKSELREIILREEDWLALRSHAAALGEEIERLKRQLSDAQYWRERHCRDAELNGIRAGDNWQRAERAESALREAREKEREWIPVSERLPEPDAWILTTNGKWTGVARHRPLDDNGYMVESERWQSETSDFIEHLGPPVTHWMPLPAAPGDNAGQQGDSAALNRDVPLGIKRDNA
jgi:polyhydroxyalkanoate synthesis regulator phasin